MRRVVAVTAGAAVCAAVFVWPYPSTDGSGVITGSPAAVSPGLDELREPRVTRSKPRVHPKAVAPAPKRKAAWSRPAATPSGVKGAAQRYARARVPASQWSCLRELWRRESNWSATSNNPTSTAFGIWQGLTETSTDYRAQVRHGLSYIASRYSTPCAALNAHDRKGWY